MRTALIIVMSAVAGCGAGVASAGPTTPTRSRARTLAAESERLRAEADAQDERVAELESLLAMSEADVRSLRAELAQARHAERSRTIRIGGAPVARDESGADPLPVPDAEPEASRPAEGARPVLRLYGEPRVEGPELFAALAAPAVVGARSVTARAPAAALPSAAYGAFDRLAVTRTDERDLPTVAAVTAAAPSGALAMPRAPSESEAASSETVAEYRRALGLLHARRFDDAVVALGAFLARNPSHAYADNATFWRGEAFYAQRAYPRAVAEFEAVVTRFPRGNKVADALLKLGLCHAHMGDRTAARAFYERVQREFPGTGAALIASREDAS